MSSGRGSGWAFESSLWYLQGFLLVPAGLRVGSLYFDFVCGGVPTKHRAAIVKIPGILQFFMC